MWAIKRFRLAGRSAPGHRTIHAPTMVHAGIRRELRLTEAMAGTQTRHLAAIMFTDVAGYTALMQRDEETARSYRDRHRRVLEEAVPRRGGDLLEHYGDGSLSIFGSAIEAVACALEIQRDLAAVPGVPLRIGIHTGDIVREAQGVYGDGVNVASRVQGLCPPGEVLVSERVYDDLKNQPGMFVRSLGRFELKNVTRPVEVFFVADADRPVPVLEQSPLPTGRRAKAVQADSEQKSIAVLPFINMSADPDNAFFADGITEEIINVLTRVHGLRVTARTSSFAFKGKEVDVRKVGSKLNVAHVLEGSVRKSGDRVRITAQLVDTQSGYHIFSDVYDRVVEDIFETQDEIALKIMEKLQASLPGDADSERLAPGRTKDPHAYSLNLRARFFLGQWSAHGAERAVEYFKQALELDPDFTAVYGGLAYAYTFLGLAGAIDKEEGIALAREAARKALELDPEGVEGQPGHGRDPVFRRLGISRVREPSSRGPRPRTQASPRYTTITRSSSEPRTDSTRRSASCGPPWTSIRFLCRTTTLLPTRTRRLAVTTMPRHSSNRASKSIRDSSRASRARDGSTSTVGISRRAVDSFEALHREAPKRETAVVALGFSYGLAGRPDDARECLKVLQEWDLGEHGGVVLSWEMALVHAGLGELDEAFEHLNDALEQRHTSLLLIRTSVRGWGGLREDPRFGELCTKIGLSAPSLS